MLGTVIGVKPLVLAAGGQLGEPHPCVVVLFVLPRLVADRSNPAPALRAILVAAANFEDATC